MKLLLDQNLSHKLIQQLSDIYPGSVHVRDVGLKSADDEAVWEYARKNGLVIVSKDADFRQELLRASAGKLSAFLEAKEGSFLILDR